MWGRAVIAAAVAACVFAPMLHATAPGAVLDQSDRSSTATLDQALTAYETVQPEQTFTAGVTGLLTDVVLPLATRYSYAFRGPQPVGPPTATGSFTIAIVDASGGLPSPKPPLAVSSDTSVPASSPDSYGDVAASFPSPAAIARGHQYAIVLIPPPPTCWTITSTTQWAPASCKDAPQPPDAELLLAWFGQLGDPYAGGFAWSRGLFPGLDAGFQTYLVPDKGPPSASARIGGTIAGTTLRLSWTPAKDDVAVDHYIVYRNSTESEQTTAPVATVRDLPTDSTSVFGVRAVDTSGNIGALSPTVSVAPAPRPSGVPSSVPAWAVRLFAWQTHGSRGARPKTPRPMPSWYAAWRHWRLNPLQVAGR